MAEGSSSSLPITNLEQYGDLPSNHRWGTIGQNFTNAQKTLVKEAFRARAQQRETAAGRQEIAANAVSKHVAAKSKSKARGKHSVENGETSVANPPAMTVGTQPRTFAFQRRPTFVASPSALPETANTALERLANIPRLDVLTAGNNGDGSFLFTQADRQRLDNTLAAIDSMGFSIPAPPSSPGLRRKLLRSLSPTGFVKKRKRTGSFDQDQDFVPERVEFASHRDYDRSDSWFEEVFDYIDHDISIFCAKHFGKMDDLNPESVPPETLAGIWGSLTDPVSAYIAEVADTPEEWDSVLRAGVERRLCVAAIIYRVLHLYIFRATLFGCTETQRTALDSTAVAMVDDDGFRRAELRAKTVRMFMGRETVTTHFHVEVEILSARIALLLQPLEDFLRDRKVSLYQEECSRLRARLQAEGFAFENEAESQTEMQRMAELESPSREEFLQDLYEIVCNTAHLSLVIERSPDIFYFRPARPGDRYNEEDHSSVDHAYYLSSRNAVMEATVAGTVDAHQIAPKVKFTLRPGLQRYKQGDGKNGGSHNGYRIYEMHKASVACYVGLLDGHEGENEREGIVEYVQRIKSAVAMQ